MLFRKRSPVAGAPASRRDATWIERTPSTLIGQHTRFRGEVRGRGAMEVRGLVEGTLRVEDRVTLRREGRMSADVAATEMLVEGSLEGEIHIQDLLVLLPTGSVQGNVESARMRVESGAVLKGTVRRRQEPPAILPEQSTP